MKILIISTSERTGGAAIAASRLLHALNRQDGIQAQMLVRDRQTNSSSVLTLPNRPLLKIYFVWERFVIWAYNLFHKKNLWQIDIANAGADITHTSAFRQADIIHLHWVNQGMLSLSTLHKIILSGKRIVWTMHDQWPSTSLCHYSEDCHRYQTHCCKCPLLQLPSQHDLSWRIFRRKQKILQKANITFVGCSQWIASLAKSSALLRDQNIVTIPNAMPAAIFHPMDQAQARQAFQLPLDKKLVLFCSQKVTDERKGMTFLMQALEILDKSDLHDKLQVVVVGKGADTLTHKLIHPLGEIRDEKSMASLYAAVDTFVTPSLQDNLPNTIAEAMCVGTPCVGFNVGGIPEMIDHLQNGYVASYRDATDLAKGIRYILTHDLRNAAAQKAATTFNEDKVAQQYIQIYEQK